MRPDMPARLDWLPARIDLGLIRRIFRYGIVGVTIGILNSLAVLLFVPLIRPLSPTVASVMAFFCVLPVGYFSHRHYSFADRQGRSGQVVRFILTNVTSFIVSVGGMYVVTEIIRISYLFGIAWTWVAVPTINFLVYMLWVFRHATPNTPR